MMWLIEATQEREPIRTRWEAVVGMTQLAFQEVRLTVELTWTNMILLPKGAGLIQVHQAGEGDLKNDHLHRKHPP